MMNRMLFLVLAALLLVGGSREAAAQDGAALNRSDEVRQMLEQRDREIKALLGQKKTLSAAEREKLKDVVNRGIDFEAMSREALGTHWADLTAAQRADFVEVFSGIVRAQSLSNLEIYRARVTYDEIDVDGQTALVKTTTVYKDVPTPVHYELGRAGGEWRVHDIVLDDVSTVEGYARSFQTVVRKRGFDSLMQSLRKKLAEVSS